MIHRSRLSGFCTLIALLASAPLASQQSEALFRDTVEVEVVSIEVVVTDKDGVPVTGLTAADFRIFEDGQPVEITNFYEVAADPRAVDEVISTTPATRTEVPAPVRTRELNLVIFIDDVNTHPSNRVRLFQSLREFLQENTSSIGQMMLVRMDNRIQVIEPLTANQELIMGALEEIQKQKGFQAGLEGERRIFMGRLQQATLSSPGSFGPSGPSSSGGAAHPCYNASFEDSIRVGLDLAFKTRTLTEQRIRSIKATVSSLNAFASTLGGLPGRKALLYLSDGLPVRPDDLLTEAWAQKFDSWVQRHETEIRNCRSFPEAGQEFQRMITQLGSAEFDLHQDLDRLGTNAADNNVVFYPLSIAGRGAGLARADVGGNTGTIARSAELAEAQTRDASLLQMADDTGGVAMTRTSNVDMLVDRIADDFGFFYSLGYSPSDGQRDAEFHRIKVEVLPSDLRVRHTKGRHRKSWRDRLGDMTAAAALFAIETNPLDVRLTAGDQVRKGKGSLVPIMVQIPLANIEMVSDGSNYSAEITVLVTVSDEKSGLSEPQRFDLPIQIPNAQILAARQQAAGYPLELLLEPGRKQIAVAVRDHIGQEASVVSIPVEVEGSSKARGRKNKKKRRG